MPLEKPTKPDAITAVPTPVPLRTDRANFAARGDAMMAWFPDGVGEINATSDYLNDAANFAEQEANEAEASAIEAEASNVAAAINAAAAAASAGAILWVTGSTYTAGVVRYSPTNFQTYRDTVGGLSSTDPASDTTGRWQSAMLPSAEAIALPDLLPTAYFNFAGGVIDRRFVEVSTTARTRVGKFGTGKAAAAGVAVADYDVVTRRCLGYRAETAATYIAINSEDFAGWGASDTGGGFGSAVAAPDGTLTAKSWTVPSSTSAFALGQRIKGPGLDASGQAVFEVWVRRPAGAGSIRLRITDMSAVPASGYLSVGTTWTKLSFTSTTLTNTGYIGVGFVGVAPGEVFEFWHPQLTLGTVNGRSYEPTVSSNVVTVGGGLTMSLATYNEVVNPNGFTIVVAFDGSTIPAAASDHMLVNLSGSAGAEQIRIKVNTGVVYAEAVTGGVTVASLNLGAVIAGRNVVAFSVAADNFAAVARGGAVATDTSGAMPAVTTLGVGCNPSSAGSEPSACIDVLAPFPRACTAGELRAFVNNY